MGDTITPANSFFQGYSGPETTDVVQLVADAAQAAADAAASAAEATAVAVSSGAVSSVAGQTGHVTLAVSDIAGAAPVDSPSLTGTPVAPTPATSNNSTLVATTAFVKAQGYAPVVSPVFTSGANFSVSGTTRHSIGTGAEFGKDSTNGVGSLLVFSGTSGQYNQVQIVGGLAGSGPTITAASGTGGTDTNVSLNLAGKGSGGVRIRGGAINNGSAQTFTVAAADTIPTVSNSAMVMNASWVGTPSPGGNLAPYYFGVTDNMASPVNSAIISTVMVDTHMGSSSKGNRAALSAIMRAATSANTQSADYVGGQLYCQANTTDGGVFSTTDPNGFKGGLFGGNSQVVAFTGATAYAGVFGHEVDVGMSTGTSALAKAGVTIVQTSNDAVRGQFVDAGILFSNQGDRTAGTTLPGWKYCILFGSATHDAPTGTDSTLIGAVERSYGQVSGSTVPIRAQYGVDFSSVTFTSGGAAFKSPGFSVDPSGALTAQSFTPNTKPTISGSRGGNAALASLITALAGLGLVTDSTTA
jgi:hypothetical protein